MPRWSLSGAYSTTELELVISYVDGAFQDAWVSDDPAKDDKYSQPNEELLVGTWSALAA